MCEACANTQSKPAVHGRRMKIWELSDGWHCAIIGTCLTLRDLRALGRKLGLEPRAGFPVDYQLHGHFVGQAAERGKTAKFLNALLDRKHAAAIRRIGKLTKPCELEAAWEGALEEGEIPGPFWAIMSHAETPKTLAERMFADVHMLSHLVGASNRADIRRLNDLEDELEQSRESLNRERQRHAERMAEKARAVDVMRTKMAQRSSAPREFEVARANPEITQLASEQRRENGELRGELKALQAELARRDKAAEDMARDLAGLQIECAELERTLTGVAYADTSPLGEITQPVDLGGRCILYVGGRPQCVNRYRQLLEQWNGELLHHDGGLEKSMHELASAIARADTVVFPCDCVSHDAVSNVKKLCRQLMKTYVPLRSSGLASLMAGLSTATFDGANDRAVHLGVQGAN